MLNLGQFFTPDFIVDKMVSLIKNNGSILEPSCGDGAFLKKIPFCTGIEIDKKYADKFSNVICMDFFDLKYDIKYDTIIGNPPYVMYKEINKSTKEKLPPVLDNRSNLYLFFIWKSLDLLKENGELIFIVPRDFLKTTSARPLNERLIKEGAFTFFEEFGDKKIFKDADPNVCIFRWQKGLKKGIYTEINDGYLSFGKSVGTLISDLFEIKVGGVSGLNDLYYNEDGNIDLVVSSTKKTGKTIKAIYVDKPNEYLIKNKDILINRKIKKFNENNWWEWGRKCIDVSNLPHIYVNTKTRDMKPFFTHKAGYYDGSVLCLILKNDNNYDIDYLIDCLNNNNWEEQGFLVGGRLIFNQRSLKSAKLILK